MEIDVPEVMIFENLLDAPEITNAWRDRESFNVSRMSTDQKKILMETQGVEFRFPGALGNPGQFEAKWQNVSKFCLKYVADSIDPVFIFASEHRSQRRNRIRSHKGFIKRIVAIQASEYLEIQYDAPNDQTWFAGLVRVTETNFAECLSLMEDSERSFAISGLSGTVDFLQQLLGTIARTSLIVNERVFLDYVNVISQICPTGATVLRLGGDGGNEYFSLQIFGIPQVLEKWRDLTGEKILGVNRKWH